LELGDIFSHIAAHFLSFSTSKEVLGISRNLEKCEGSGDLEFSEAETADRAGIETGDEQGDGDNEGVN
jgi:hypothetical protein